jgi:PAS domain S-box-containing protein
VTDQDRAQHELREAEEKFRSLFECAAVGIGRVGLDGRYLQVNRRYAEIVGYSVEELQRLDFQTITHPDDVGADLAELRRLAAGEVDAYGTTKRYVRKDGGTVWVSLTVGLARDRAGRPAYCSVVVEDVTARKRAADQASVAEAVLAHAGMMAQLGAWWIEISNPEDVDSNPLRWSEEVYRIFGYAPGEVDVSNDLFFRHVHPDDRQRVADAVGRALAAGERYAVEHRIVRRDGVERTVLEHGEAQRDTTGRPLRIVGAVQDVTERKRMEDELREADRRKTEFLAVLSHELRNPLAPIRNSIALLDRLPGGSEQAAHARQVIARQTGHLTKLVDDLLDLTRISHGKVELNREVVDLRELVRRTRDDHRGAFEQRGVDLRFDDPPRPVFVSADPTRLAQVVGNLLQNAAKFTSRGGSTVIRVGQTAGRAEIRVRDDGIGMDPSQVTRMFEPFAQADGGLARTAGGLGLGLALVKGLVELHGGTVSAHSDGLGRGSEFVLELPLAADPAASDARTPQPAAVRSRRIVVIEDNVDAAQTLADLLELDGHRVEVAHDASSGMSLARAARPDFVICDVGLPDLSGYEVARRLRADGALAGTRLIALTGYAQPEDRRRAAEAGFHAHLAKPPPLEALSELLAAEP